MSQVFNIYCDESCHLENDGQKAMVLGAVWCSLEKTRKIAVRLREIKKKHDMPFPFEAKWTKVSPAKKSLYLDLIDYFFDDDDLHFRALIVPDKGKLRHDAIPGQDHDTWYYKMYFDMLKVILRPDTRYRIYLDIKDTRGAKKAAKLHDVLCNNMYDFSREVIGSISRVNYAKNMRNIGRVGYKRLKPPKGRLRYSFHAWWMSYLQYRAIEHKSQA